MGATSIACRIKCFKSPAILTSEALFLSLTTPTVIPQIRIQKFESRGKMETVVQICRIVNMKFWAIRVRLRFHYGVRFRGCVSMATYLW